MKGPTITDNPKVTTPIDKIADVGVNFDDDEMIFVDDDDDDDEYCSFIFVTR